MNTDLITKYRPTKFEDVVGQPHAVSAIKKMISNKSARVFIIVGPTGSGKTTLARIIASAVNCNSDLNYLEVNAAVNGGAEELRQLVRGTEHGAWGDKKAKVTVVDEIHALSKAGFSILLKTLEEPTINNYFVLCTTEQGKLPEAIASRSNPIILKRADSEALLEFLKKVDAKEKYNTSEKVLQVIAEKAKGSYRTSLSILAELAGETSRKKAIEALDNVDTDLDDENNPSVMLCRRLIKGEMGWDEAMKLVKPLKDANAESVRMVIVAYFQNCLLNPFPGTDVQNCLAVLEAFSKPYYNQTGIWPVMLSLGGLIYGGNDD